MKRKFTTYLDEDLIQYLKIKAAMEKRSVAEIITELVCKLKEDSEREK